jgi:FdhE protein
LSAGKDDVAKGRIANLFGRSRAASSPASPELAAAQERLAQLAAEHPELSAAAAVQGALLRALAQGPALVATLDLAPERAAAKLAAGTPLLRGEALGLDAAELRDCFGRLAAAAVGAGAQGARPIQAALQRRALDPAELAQAVLDGDGAAVVEQAAALDVAGDLLGTLLRFSLFGPLSALAAQLKPLREATAWGEGYCPTCGGWPLLAEQRGLEQLRYLRCGICASEWQVDRLRCPFCANRDHEQLAYLFVEGQDSRRVATCDQCHGYVKVLNTLVPIPAYDLPVQDLATLHLDLVALERGFAPA